MRSGGPPSRPRLEQIPLGVHVPSANELGRDAARSILEIPNDAFVILYMGRLSEKYKADLEPLLNGVAYLLDRGKKVRLLLAGQASDLEYNAQLERYIHILGISHVTLRFENFAEFLKSVFLSACNVGVFPVDSIQESFGLAILETMAHARPVIASDWSGYRDLILHGATGFLIPSRWSPSIAKSAGIFAGIDSTVTVAHNAAQGLALDVGDLVRYLEWLMENPDAASDMGLAGQQHVAARYSWKVVAAQFRMLWEEQLGIASAQNFPPQNQLAGLDLIFNSYPSSLLSETDWLIRSPLAASDIVVNAVLSYIRNAQTLILIRAVLRDLEERPISLAEAKARGLREANIIFLAKKGLCRLIDEIGAKT
ncbi:glycosyltransferase family 4 protein [Terriglobus albidus]|nr:glycosyltransferase family 4 protein [Terriglobus albidus]